MVCSLHTIPSCAHRTHILTHIPHTELHTHAHMHLTGSLPHTSTQLHPHGYTSVPCPPRLCTHSLTQSHSPTKSAPCTSCCSYTQPHTLTHIPQIPALCLSHMYKACTRSSLGAHGQYNEGLSLIPQWVPRTVQGLVLPGLLLACELQLWRQLGFYSSERAGVSKLLEFVTDVDVREAPPPPLGPVGGVGEEQGPHCR